MTFKTIEAFFDSYKFQEKPLILDQCTTINNPKLFVETHITILKANSGNTRFKPYYDRLIKLYKFLNNGKHKI